MRLAIVGWFVVVAGVGSFIACSSSDSGEEAPPASSLPGADASAEDTGQSALDAIAETAADVAAETSADVAPDTASDVVAESATDGSAESSVEASADAIDDTSDAGSVDSGGDASGPLTGAGPYAIAYAGANIGVDTRRAAATWSGLALASFTTTINENVQANSNAAVEVGASGPIAWGRWSGGTTAGNQGAFTWAANGGLHYVIGDSPTSVPTTGSGAWTLVGTTSATVSDGSLAVGTISGTVSVSFGTTSKVGVSLVLDVPGDATYAVASTGGSADPSQSELSLAAGSTNYPKAAFGGVVIAPTAGGACAGGSGCFAIVDGFLAGAGADHLGLVAHVYNGLGGAPKSVSGAMVFAKP